MFYLYCNHYSISHEQQHRNTKRINYSLPYQQKFIYRKYSYVTVSKVLSESFFIYDTTTKQVGENKKEREIRQSRDKRSPVMEEILMSLRSDWLDKVNTPHMEYVIYSMLKLFFYFHVTHISIVQNHKVDKLMI